MNDNIDKNEIRRAIDRLQAEHPCGIAYDPTAFVNMEAVDTIKKCVDKIARRMMEDTEINVICEFAKLYLDGVKPTIDRPHGEWIWKKDEDALRTYDLLCSECGYKTFTCENFDNVEQAKKLVDDKIREGNTLFPFCPNCGARMKAGDPDA